MTPEEKAAYEAVRTFQLAMKRHRQAAGLSFGKWAPLIGMRKQALQRMEASDYNPSLAQASRIARFFGKTLGEFLSHVPIDNASVDD